MAGNKRNKMKDTANGTISSRDFAEFNRPLNSARQEMKGGDATRSSSRPEGGGGGG